jgi:WD40 repeat protein
VIITAIVLALIAACLGTGMVLPVPYRFIKRRQRSAVRYIARACAAATAGIALAAVGVTGASASGVTPRALQTARVTAAGTSLAVTSPGAQVWVARYDNPGNGGATSVAVSPNGKTVFVTGYVTAGGLEDYATVAYNAATGAQIWAARYNDPGHVDDRAYSVAVSPNGKAVFVTGFSIGLPPGEDYATIAYNAATGAQLWAALYGGFGNGGNFANSVAVSEDGKTVFVTGYTETSSTSADYVYATIAYSAATGAQLWLARYIGPGTFNEAYPVAVSPSGGTVYVTGYSYGSPGSVDEGYATVAYNAATGAQLWVERYVGAGSGNEAFSVAVSPTTGTVFVTGSSLDVGFDYATIAYSG